jgi:hypothetical protein
LDDISSKSSKSGNIESGNIGLTGLHGNHAESVNSFDPWIDGAIVGDDSIGREVGSVVEHLVVNTIVRWVGNSSDSSSKDWGTIDKSGISVRNDSSVESRLVNNNTISISVSIVQSCRVFSMELLS